ncbi:hypothetical protein, partial [Nostoc piscinale]|uniref:hypothetical protein n=1 Tax=Nostoc piscinale TaxID=224012 RepID=UPI0039A74376
RQIGIRDSLIAAGNLVSTSVNNETSGRKRLVTLTQSIIFVKKRSPLFKYKMRSLYKNLDNSNKFDKPQTKLVPSL